MRSRKDTLDIDLTDVDAVSDLRKLLSNGYRSLSSPATIPIALPGLSTRNRALFFRRNSQYPKTEDSESTPRGSFVRIELGYIHELINASRGSVSTPAGD